MDATIWCYTTDSSTVKEKCLPINFCLNTLSPSGVTSKIVQFGDLFVLSAKNDIITNS